MISSQGAGFAAPTGTAADMLGFVNRWQQASNAGRESGYDLMSDMYKGNQMAAQMNDQGRNNLLTDLTGTTDIYDMANDQTLERMRMEYLACINGGGDPDVCRARFDAAVGRTPRLRRKRRT